MKIIIYILTAFLFLLFSCKDPNVNGPDTKISINEKVDYEILGEVTNGFTADNISESVIRNRNELSEFLSLNSGMTNLDIVDKMLKVDFDNNIIVVISANNLSEKSNITIDTLYLDGNGKIQLSYRIFQQNGVNAKMNNPTLVLLIKNRKEARINFTHKIQIEGENQKFDGFQTLATDVQIDSRKKWKLVFRNMNDVNEWADEFKAKDISFFNDVDFDKEMVISVGTGRLNIGGSTYRISDIKQQGSHLIVSSVFELSSSINNITKANNHFVKIRKTEMPIDFNPTVVVNNVQLGEEVYAEPYRFISFETNVNNKASVTKVSNLADLFAIIKPNSDFNPANAEIDFEYFDLLVVKSPTMQNKTSKFDLVSLNITNHGLKGLVIFYPNVSDGNNKSETYALIRIIKTNTPISDNFEVIVK